MRIKQKYHKILSPFSMFFLFCLYSSTIYAQTYGLKFQGINVTPDKRTELNLTPNSFLKFQNEFEISFEYRVDLLKPRTVFGYIFRIINQDNNNIDLLSTPTPSVNLNVVVGKSNSIIKVSYPENAANNWIKLRAKFLLSEDRMIFYTADTFYVSDEIGFKKQDAFKIIFGANDCNQFRTTDVPSMEVRDIKIYEQGKLKFYWLLDENGNNVATDKLRKHKAVVKNPSWLKLNHQNWNLNFEDEFDGYLMVTADIENDKIYMAGAEGLIIFSTEDNQIQKIKYQSKPLFLNQGYRVVFNHLDKRIYCYLVDGGPVYSLNVETGEWDSAGPVSNIQTKYRHHNSYLSASDSSIYLFGGYGIHSYNNEIRRFGIYHNTWENLPTNDTIFYPRYLAGLGSLNDTIYILGGYGSESGNQLINPKSYFDLFGYSVNDRHLFKKFEIPRVIDNLTVANTIWIDKESRDFYALVFDKMIFEGYLRLIKGNLDSPEIDFVGNKIPFRFLDIKSFASLFYMPRQQKLFAYTSYLTDSTTTQAAIYSISYPPNISLEETEKSSESSVIRFLYISMAFLLLLSSAIWFYLRRKKRMKVQTGFSNENKEAVNALQTLDFSSEGDDGALKYQLIFFGGFQVINKDLKDITNKFSPLLKELFLLIWLHTFKNNKGISSEKITERLWFDKSAKSAGNNRAVNIAKLRTIISEVGACELTKKTGYWKIIHNEQNIKSDYVELLQITGSKSNLSKQKIIRLIEITQKGAFLLNVNYDWLDDFKADVSDRIVDTLVVFAKESDIKKDADFIIHLADCIFNFDKINEEALALKCKAQHFMGKHSLAKSTYEKFVKEYQLLYDQEFQISFLKILNEEN